MVAAGIGIRSAMPADSASSKSTIHFIPASIASCSPLAMAASVAAIGVGRLRIRTYRERPTDVLAGCRQRDATARVHDRDPAIGHQARLRRVTPRLVALGQHDRWEQRRRRQRGAGRRRGRRPLGRIGRREDAHDPRSAARAEAIGDLPPRIGGRTRPVTLEIAGSPVLLPVVLAPRLLVCRQIRLVAVEMNLVRKDAHAQFRAAVGEREEAGLQPDRQQHERQVARTQRRRRHCGARGGNRDRTLEVIRHLSASVIRSKRRVATRGW